MQGCCLLLPASYKDTNSHAQDDNCDDNSDNNFNDNYDDNCDDSGDDHFDDNCKNSKAVAFCCRHLIRIQTPTLGMTIAMTILITTLMTIIMTITDYSNGDDSSDAHYDDNCKSCKTVAFCYNS